MGTPPTNSMMGWYFKTGGNPVNDTDALGGSPDFATPITPTTNNFILSPTILGTLNQYRGVGTLRQEASGTLTNARVTNRCGGIVPAASGLFTFASSSAADTGTLWVAYLLGGVWTVEELPAKGKTTVTGANNWDISTPWWACYEPLTAPAGNFLLQVAGQSIGVMFGTGDNPDSTDISQWQCGSLYDMALSTALNTPIMATNRKTDPDPTTISAFAQATSWQGADNSLSVPGGTMILNDAISLIGRLNLPSGGFPKPPGGKLRFAPDLIGDPTP